MEPSIVAVVIGFGTVAVINVCLLSMIGHLKWRISNQEENNRLVEQSVREMARSYWRLRHRFSRLQSALKDEETED